MTVWRASAVLELIVIVFLAATGTSAVVFQQPFLLVQSVTKKASVDYQVDLLDGVDVREVHSLMTCIRLLRFVVKLEMPQMSYISVVPAASEVVHELMIVAI